MNEFRLDLNRCTGCQACELACRIENGVEVAAGWRTVHTFNPERVPGVPLFHLSLACSHCAQAPCMKHCPALAFSRDPVTGAVLLDSESCIGCRYCSWACPFDAPRFRPEAGVASKCTFCNDRLHRGLDPACIVACPTAALGYGPTAPGPGPDAPGFPATPFAPSIRFVPLREGASGPECSTPSPQAAPPAGSPADSPDRGRLHLRSEWPLLAFTLAAATLVGLACATAIGGISLRPAWIAAGSILSMTVSTMHLGRKGRAWRALRNVRRSWLSREIAVFGMFAACQVMAALSGDARSWWSWAAVALGFAALFSIDRVYDVLLQPVPTSFHSASALLTGLFLSLLLAGNLPAAAAAGALKFALYLGRHRLLACGARRMPPAFALVRIGAGFVAPALVWSVFREAGNLAALSGIAVGEIVDRAEYYLELEIQSPGRELAREFSRQAGAALRLES